MRLRLPLSVLDGEAILTALFSEAASDPEGPRRERLRLLAMRVSEAIEAAQAEERARAPEPPPLLR